MKINLKEFFKKLGIITIDDIIGTTGKKITADEARNNVLNEHKIFLYELSKAYLEKKYILNDKIYLASKNGDYKYKIYSSGKNDISLFNIIKYNINNIKEEYINMNYQFDGPILYKAGKTTDDDIYYYEITW
jgi:hypothetical protein